MAEATQQPIVVKKIKKGGGGAHGGAWKLAYADFVTAMMAFFLLMWLLGSTAQGDLEGIADYFQNPLKLAMAGGEGSETWRPLGLVVVGGLSVSTLVTLVIVPVLYFIVERHRARARKEA